MSLIVFLVVSRILALKENFLLKFKMDVSLKSSWTCFLNLNLLKWIITLLMFHIWCQACSHEDRRRDFEKIFAHYDVVSLNLDVDLFTVLLFSLLSGTFAHRVIEKQPYWAFIKFSRKTT